MIIECIFDIPAPSPPLCTRRCTGTRDGRRALPPALLPRAMPATRAPPAGLRAPRHPREINRAKRILRARVKDNSYCACSAAGKSIVLEIFDGSKSSELEVAYPLANKWYNIVALSYIRIRLAQRCLRPVSDLDHARALDRVVCSCEITLGRRESGSTGQCRVTKPPETMRVLRPP